MLLERFAEGSIANSEFTHWVMLRCIWLILREVHDRSTGRQPAVTTIMAAQERAATRVFHVTQTYFWIQLARSAAPIASIEYREYLSYPQVHREHALASA